MSFAAKLRRAPLRVVTGAFILNSGLGKLSTPTTTRRRSCTGWPAAPIRILEKVRSEAVRSRRSAPARSPSAAPCCCRSSRPGVAGAGADRLLRRAAQRCTGVRRACTRRAARVRPRRAPRSPRTSGWSAPAQPWSSTRCCRVRTTSGPPPPRSSRRQLPPARYCGRRGQAMFGRAALRRGGQGQPSR